MTTDNTITIDVEDLTIEEIEIVEDVTGRAFDEAFQPGAPKGRLMRALAYVSERRTNPSITLEEVGKRRLVLEDTANPTEAAAP
jgi:hypothetical protein